jgi:signal recognition particle subunit SRP68
LIKHALDETSSALPVLSAGPDANSGSSPRNIHVTKNDVQALHALLSGELQRSRALVEILNSNKKASSATAQSGDASKPLGAQLSNYPSSGVNLDNIVTYPPRLEPIPVKPLFLDVAWNYIEYPDQRAQASSKEAERAQERAGTAGEPEAKPQKRGWFGFGR